jgi:hypothetical protein
MTHSEKLERIRMLISSPDVMELGTLISEVAAYERVHFPVALPTLGEAMQFRRMQMGETQKEISMRAGISLNRWMLLEKGMSPSLKDARCLHAVGIPADVIFPKTPRPADHPPSKP